MYIIFKYFYDSPVIVFFHYICNNASKYDLFANFGSPNRTKSYDIRDPFSIFSIL